MSLQDERESWHDGIFFPPALLADVVAAVEPRRLLILDPLIAMAGSPGMELRRLPGPTSIPLQDGVAFETAGAWSVLVGGPSTPAVQARWLSFRSADQSDPAVNGRSWFDALWDQGVDGGPGPRFEPGTPVTRDGDESIWTVARNVRRTEMNTWVTQIIRGDHVTETDETNLEAARIEYGDLSSWVRTYPAASDDFARTLALLKLSNPLTNIVYAYLSTRTVFRSWQFRPLLRLLNSPNQRLLIADEVGLGKTIEAGLIWAELHQRVGVKRALVVCPSVLTRKWKDELRRRFDLEVEILDRAGLASLVDLVRSDDPRPFRAIVSLEMFRGAAELAELNDLAPRFDLIIVDEAHYMRNANSRSHALGEALSDWADVLLFLSATPLNLARSDLFNLLNLLAEEEFSDPTVFESQIEPNRHLNALGRQLLSNSDTPRSLLDGLDLVARLRYGDFVSKRPEFELLYQLLDRPTPLDPAELAQATRYLGALNTLSTIVSRTRKAETKERRIIREPLSVRVDWTPAETRVYQAVQAWARRRAMVNNGVVGFATQMPLRQAASSLPALHQLLSDRYGFSSHGDDLDDVPEIAGSPTDEDVDELDDDQLRRLAEELEETFRQIGGTDTKYDQLEQGLRMLGQAGVKQVMVFSFFRRTLAYLEQRLTASGKRVRVMHGATNIADRERVMRDFRRGEFDLLLLSEVGSEGLDFEFCQGLVNYDLPWNPMRVEQRIGRLDRFGSPHEKIFILNFQVPGTIETEIFSRLYNRIKVFEQSIGELEPILREELVALTRVALDPRLSEQERELEVRRIAAAAEAQRQDLDDLHEAERQLHGLDQVAIDGFQRETEDTGHFVGAPELRRMVESLISGTGATLKPSGGGDPPGIYTLQGTPELQRRVASTGLPPGFPRPEFQRLLRSLKDEELIRLTFDQAIAMSGDIEFVSLRHPFVHAAVKHSAAHDDPPGRFHQLQIEADHPGLYLVGLWLVDATGLRPSLELWSVAVDLKSGEVRDEIGTALLRRAAKGELRDSRASATPSELDRAVGVAERELDRRRAQAERQQRAGNELLIDAQIEARRDGFELKIRKARRTLEKVQGTAPLVRLYRGRIRNLEAMAATSEDELNAKRGLVLSSQPAVVVVVEVV